MSPVQKSRLFSLLVGIATVMVILSGCGSHQQRAARPIGDPDGVAIEFTVDFTWQYLDAMGPLVPAYPNAYAAPPPSVVYIGPGAAGPQIIYSSGAPAPYGSPYDNSYDPAPPIYYSAGYQHVFLLAGNGPVEAECFHRRIHPGHHRFLARVRPGRTITLSIQADGNRNGWKVIGHFTAAGADGGRVHIVLDATGSVLQVFPPREYATAPGQNPSATDSQVVAPAADARLSAAPAAPAAVQPAPASAPAAPASEPVPAAAGEPAVVDPANEAPVPTQALPAAPAPATAPQP